MNKWNKINESEENAFESEHELIDDIWMMLDDSKKWGRKWELYFKDDTQFRMENKETGQWFTLTVKED
mgnify:CR=1 FL=1